MREREGGFDLPRLAAILLVVLILVSVGRIAFICGYSIFHETASEAPPGREVELTIPEGAGTWEIARTLERMGLIDRAWVFMAQERLSAYHGKLGSGRCVLNTSMKPTEIIASIYEQTSS